MPGKLFAQTAEDQVVNQLRRQGYDRITVARTLLGRTRIVAIGPRGSREIVLNPSTGAILRDYVDRSDSDGRQGNESSGNSSGSDDDDRDDRDNDRDDDSDDDRDDDRGGGGGDDDG